ncbi:branched-chain amino acid transport system II carrier protein [Cytobacillus sp. FJAT-54145]|uniref:Branched-chain amino acid transport system carrier protein n=1 Tax=Cytobacillus spartinae TaxID=3299023 RepID=A0ABW6KH45_9BACI
MNHNLSSKEILIIGFMLFAIFFGAGNMIFPPLLGQLAGENVWIALLGFLLTGVGLPLLGIIAIAKSGGDLQHLASKVHPTFGIIFSIIMYLAIGPMFGIPRTGTVSFEVGIKPFLGELSSNGWSLFIYSLIYFSITAWLSLNPSKIVDRIGKVLTPLLFLVISILIIKALTTPMGKFTEPNNDYETSPFFRGFLEGYFTMDTIASLVFGIVLISAIQNKHSLPKKAIMKICIQAGVIAAIGLAFVYTSLAYMGAVSVDSIGYFDNGGQILSGISNTLFGPLGMIILGTAITFACLTTSIGLISACSQYFSKLFKISYSKLVLGLSIFSFIVSNVGLTQLISFSVPVLLMIYPPAIVLIVLSFFHSLYKNTTYVYRLTLILTSIVSILDGLAQSKIPFAESIKEFLLYLPLQSIGIGWVIPALLGVLIGCVLQMNSRKTTN